MTSHGPSTGDTPVTSSPQVPFVQGHSYLDPEALVTLFESDPVKYTESYKPTNLPFAIKTTAVKPTEISEDTDSPEDLTVLDAIVPSYPWSAFGKLFIGLTTTKTDILWSGVGALVGPNMVLTSSHTIPWEHSEYWIRFVPGYNNGTEPSGSSHVVWIHGSRISSLP